MLKADLRLFCVPFPWYVSGVIVGLCLTAGCDPRGLIPAPPVAAPPAAPVPANAAPANAAPAGIPAGATGPVAAAAGEASSLYGDQGGEEVVAADPSIPETLLRARAGDTFYKLSKVRVGQGRFGRPTLSVDYEVTRQGEFNGVTANIHGSDGSRQTFVILGPMDSHGTLDLEGDFTNFGRPPFPENLEVYFTRQDTRFGLASPTFKVSNSMTLGTMTRLVRPRDWTAEEIARLTAPPPNYTNPNAHPNVGHDTMFAGDTEGGINARFVEPGGYLLGLEHARGAWDNEECVGQIVPIFQRDQPPTLPTRELAKEGYAVGGMEVQSKRYANAIRLTFMRIKPDGSLDPADSYAGDWLGFPEEKEPIKLAGDGKKVIGINLRRGGIINGVALVVE